MVKSKDIRVADLLNVYTYLHTAQIEIVELWSYREHIFPAGTKNDIPDDLLLYKVTSFEEINYHDRPNILRIFI